MRVLCSINSASIFYDSYMPRKRCAHWTFLLFQIFTFNFHMKEVKGLITTGKLKLKTTKNDWKGLKIHFFATPLHKYFEWTERMSLKICSLFASISSIFHSISVKLKPPLNKFENDWKWCSVSVHYPVCDTFYMILPESTYPVTNSIKAIMFATFKICR